MNPIIRNLVHVLRRFKLAALLNVLGLSVAFAAFMIIMTGVKFDFSFDRFHQHHDRIFRLEGSLGGTYYAFTSRPVAEQFFQSSPHIVAGTVIDFAGIDVFVKFDEESNAFDEENVFREHLAFVSNEIFDVFTFDIVEGAKDVFDLPSHIMIPQSFARKLFGDEPAVGRQVYSYRLHTRDATTLFTIGAVYRDFPANSIIQNIVYAPVSDDFEMSHWAAFNIKAFIRVNDVSNVDLLLQNFMRSDVFPSEWDRTQFGGIGLRLSPLSGIRFATDVSHDIIPKRSLQMLMILFAIGIIIILIAGINFTNFSMALMPMRVKNINTQRVLGAQQNTIRLMLIVEAIVFTVVSYLIATLFIKLFSESLLWGELLASDLLVIGGTALVAIVLGILVGLYPAYFITSFAPALALKGNYGLSPKGKKWRNALIGIQFIASFALIIAASFMYLQTRFMQNVPLGFDRDELIVVDKTNIWQYRDAFFHKIRAHSGVESITYSDILLSSSDYHSGFGYEYNGQMPMFTIIAVDYRFLQLMGISIVDGRDFRAEDMGGYDVFILNEAAHRQFNIGVHSRVFESEIIGIASDIHFTSLRRPIEPLLFRVVSTPEALQQIYIRVRAGADMRAVMAHVRATIAEFNAPTPIEPRFFDEVLQQLYDSEIRLSRWIIIFSLIAIFISIVGVFGLVVFDSECRRKEIGIRKVHGASTMSIVLMFNKMYVKILLICFAIAVPVAWYAVGRWLENFAYRTPMYWWVFVLAFVAVAAITVLTVTIQNWRVANEDPVKSIKTE